MTLSADGVVIVTHEPIADPAFYRDTAPVVAGDRLHPYVGRGWHQLDLRRIRTLDAAGTARPADARASSAGPRSVPDATVPTLGDVLRLVRRIAAPTFRLEIEIKHDPRGLRHAPGAALLARRVVSTIRGHRMAARCRIRSFDWRVLVAARRIAPEIPIVALATADTISRGSRRTAGARVGRSPWDRSLADAAAHLGAAAIVPEEGLVGRSLVSAVSRHGLGLLPWTVNDLGRAQELVALGVDGLTTDRPDLLRLIRVERDPTFSPRAAAPGRWYVRGGCDQLPFGHVQPG